MKRRKIAGTVAIALFSALVALFIYTRFFDDPAVIVEVNDNQGLPVQFTNNYPAFGDGMTDFADMAEYAVHTVVHVKTKSMQEFSYRNPIMDYFYGEQARQPREVRGFGSGVIINKEGYIITNNHVIEDVDNVEVTLNDNRTFPAEVIGRDPSTDIALLKIETENLPFLKYGDSDELRLGEWVLAIGNPFNLTSTVTAGIVSAKGRSLNLLDSRYRIEAFIQTDAALNSGNSGGALVNTRGELVGITTAIISPSGAYAGNSFAVPVNIVKKVVDDLIEFGEVQRAIIGVNITDVTSEIAKAEKLNQVKGVFITGINEGGAAEEAGLKEKDVIVRINNKSTDSAAELQEEIGKKRPGDKVNIVVLRNNKEQEYAVELRNLEGNTNIVRVGEGGGIIFGAQLDPLTADERSHYQIEKGLKVSSLQDGRFKDLGIGRGWVITEVNGEEVNSIREIRDASDNGERLRSVKGIQSNGTYFSYLFR
ncbi:MAG TPA: Do family serine endopeptidase [Bacteroidales bacterium]|nr:Do family serine endopeptidase [Bacteroidales bacterium]